MLESDLHLNNPAVYSQNVHIAMHADRDVLPRDAMRKRGLCSRPVSVCPSVTLVHCI